MVRDGSRMLASTRNGSQRPTGYNGAGPSQSQEDFSQTQAILSDEVMGEVFSFSGRPVPSQMQKRPLCILLMIARVVYVLFDQLHETNKLVAEVMRYMLFKNYQQPGVPVSRLDLTGIITKIYKQRYLSSLVISMAQKKLLQVFGLEMKEYNRLRSQTKAGRGFNEKQVELKEYVLRSTVPANLRKEYIDTRESAAMNSLATVVIGIIKCSGERCPEEVLWQNLRRLDIREDDVNHPTFGNVKNAVDMLAKQRYIQKEKLISSEGDGFVYELAERAMDEQCLARMENFMLSILQRNPESAHASQQGECSQFV